MSTTYLTFDGADKNLTEELTKEILESFKTGKDLKMIQPKMEDMKSYIQTRLELPISNLTLFKNSLNDELRLSQFEEQ